MRLRPERGPRIPTSEPGRLAGFRRRTTVARAGLAAALAGLLVLCVVVARQYDVRHAPLVASGKSGIIVLDLSASVFEGGFEATVRKLVRTDERDQIVAALREQEIGCAAYYTTPTHLQPAMRYLGWEPGSLPETERAAAENLALPMWGGIDVERQARVVAAVRAAVGVAV